MKRVIGWPLLTGASSFILAFAFAQSRPAVDVPTSLRAVKAIAAYRDGVRRLDDEYAQKVSTLQEQYVKELDAARKAALAADDLEEALRLLAEKRRIEAIRPQPGTAKGMAILSALIGVEGRWVDITLQVRRLVNNSQLHFAPSDLSAVPDVAAGTHKSIIIAYAFDGSAQLSTSRDDEMVDLPRTK